MRMSQPRTFADVLVSPVTGRAELVRDFVMALAGSALIAVCAKIRIGGPVPFTMQSWAVILLGFLPAAIVVGWLAERKWDRHFFTAVIAVGIGDAIILTIGVCWLAYLSGFRSALSLGLRPLWIADLLKILLAALALPGVWRLIGRGTRIP